MTARPEKLAIAVTFHFSQSRLAFLSSAGKDFSELADHVEVWVVTNDASEQAHSDIKDALGHCSVSVLTPQLLGHPYLLTWAHRSIFHDLYFAREDITHFLYIEDDLQFGPSQVQYWMEAANVLAPFGLVPGFVRYEETAGGDKVSSDIYKTHNYWDMARVEVGQYAYVNFRYPYQGLYMMDRAMMGEFLSARSFSPDHGRWRIREKASQGLIYENVPRGCFSRAFVGFENGTVDPAALVHHLPNNYANSGSKYGSIPIDDLVSTRKLRVTPLIKEMGKVISWRLPKRREIFVAQVTSDGH